jgi:HD-like signal output (HDOD) protein
MTDTPQLGNMIERSIRDISIPPCPMILDRFMSEARKEEPDFRLMASIIGTDVGISASLIKTANSVFFGTRHHVRSVNEALTMLGMQTAGRAVAGIILRKTFPNVPNLQRFWDSSARIAHLSGWLALHLRISGLQAEDTYTFGLFRDCGIPVLLGHYAEYESILQEASTDIKRSFTDVENAVLPTNHAMVGCILAQNWWLPEETSLAIRNHHNLAVLKSDKLPLLSRRLIATSQLAEYIAEKQTRTRLTEEWPKLGGACLQLLNLEEGQLESLCTEAESALHMEQI